MAEDGVLFREGVARLLGEAGFTVTACCASAVGLLAAVGEEPPDVALVDIRLPPSHTDEGVRAALEIRARYPAVGVLVLSQYVELGLAMRLFAGSMEGVGYLLKDRVGDLGEFADALRRVGAGGCVVDPALVEQLLARRRGRDRLERVTAREREVLGLMAEGRSNQGIAERLGVSERAVQKHITGIFGKLGLGACEDDHRRVLAVLAYLRTNRVG